MHLDTWNFLIARFEDFMYYGYVFCISAECHEVKVPESVSVVCYRKEGEYLPKLHQ
jgi:hypothetical protein